MATKKAAPAKPTAAKTTASKKTTATKKPASREAELLALLTKYKDAYYNDAPLVSDAAYDALEDEFRDLVPDHEFFATVGAPAAAVTSWEKAQHAIPMGSLNKAVSEEEFRAWAARCDELGKKDKLGAITKDLFVTEKLDGLSLAVTYENGKLSDAITRGDGQLGERILANAKRMKGVPPKLKKPVSITVRGEIILKLSDMKKAFPGAANPRNQASGTSKRFDGQGCEHLTVMFYDLDGEELKTETKKFARLAELGLIVPFGEATDLDGALKIHQDYSKTRRAKLDYEIDGLVVRAHDVRTQHMLGELGNRPRAAVAYKFASQAKVSKLIDILWETGSSGRVTPVAIVEPVQLAGAMVQRASLHNAGNVAELGIGIGDEVLISRRNDVIPYVEEVVKSAGKPAKPPTTCGICKAKLEKVGEYISCRNYNDCQALIEGRIENWIAALGVLEWGDKLINQLVESELVREPADLYKLKPAQIAGLERRGMVIAEKVLANLKAQLPLSLPKFLAALGIENLGLQTAKAIAGKFDTLEKIQAAKEAELAAIPGVGPAKGKAAFEGLASRKAEIKRLLAVGVVPVAKARRSVSPARSVVRARSSSRWSSRAAARCSPASPRTSTTW
jgi:DNA ligase (NAD+)